MVDITLIKEKIAFFKMYGETGFKLGIANDNFASEAKT